MRGVSALARALEGVPEAEVSVIVIWEPVLPADRRPPGRSVTRPLSRRQAALFWDPTLAGSRAMIRRAQREPERVPPHVQLEPDAVVWDLVATWPPGARWDAEPPWPDWFAFPVVDAEDVLRQKLAPAFREELATAWPPVAEALDRATRRVGPGIADEKSLAHACATQVPLMERVAVAGDEAQRLAAVKGLGACTSAASLAVLEGASRDASPAVRAAAVLAIEWLAIRHQDTDVRALRDALDDPAWDVRFTAARHLARREEDRERAVAVLAPGMRSANARTRRDTARALAGAGLPATRALEAVVFDESAPHDVRVDAVRALRHAWSHPDLAAADRVLARAATLPVPSLAAEAVAARGLRRDAPPEAVAELVRMTGSPDPQARLVAFRAIAVPFLEMQQVGTSMAETREEMAREAALDTLRVLGDEWSAAIPVLRELSLDELPGTRAWAAEALALVEAAQSRVR